MKTKLIVVAGPTAVGKTALGIELAKRFNGEIISGDSQQVYRQLNIGTAKATPDEQAAAVHHLIDVRDVDESYSAYDFVTEAEAAITDIVSRGKLPIIGRNRSLFTKPSRRVSPRRTGRSGAGFSLSLGIRAII